MPDPFRKLSAFAQSPRDLSGSDPPGNADAAAAPGATPPSSPGPVSGARPADMHQPYLIKEKPGSALGEGLRGMGGLQRLGCKFRFRICYGLRISDSPQLTPGLNRRKRDQTSHRHNPGDRPCSTRESEHFFGEFGDLSAIRWVVTILTAIFARSDRTRTCLTWPSSILGVTRCVAQADLWGPSSPLASPEPSPF